MGIYKAMKQRTPWSAFFITLLFSPVISMLYLNRGLYALGYLIFAVILTALETDYFASIFPDDVFNNIERINLLLFTVIGLVHSVRLAKAYNKFEDLRWYARIILPLTAAFFPVILVLLSVKIFLYEPFHIPSGSMEPNYVAGDMVAVKKTTYGYSRYSFPMELKLWEGRKMNAPPKRGDPVIFAHPKRPFIDYFKRVIGMPGDTVQMKNGTLYINDQPVEHKKIEPYQSANGKMFEQYLETLPDGTRFKVLNEIDTDHLDNTAAVTVPDNHYFVMGDNRDNSSDSRVFGPVHEDFLIGPVVLQIKDGKTNGFVFQDAQ